jgi:ubiquinone/menaquinone biosynthesis C-methylase UbiE
LTDDAFAGARVEWDRRAARSTVQAVCSGCGSEEAFWRSGRAEAEGLTRALGVTPPGAVLDVGAGPGRVAAPLAALLPGVSVLAADVSDAMLTAGRARHASLPNLTWLPVGVGWRLDLPDDSVSWAYEILCFQHVPFEHLPAILRELGRVLHRNAPLGCMVPTAAAEVCDRSRRVPPTDTWTSRAYSRAVWAALMDEAGFDFRRTADYGMPRKLALWTRR